MVRAPHKKIIVAVLLLAAVAVITFAAQPIRNAVCFPFLSPEEKKIIGVWQSQSIGGVGVTTIHSDHTWTHIGGCFDPPPTIRGRWRVEGSDIVFELDSRQFGDLPTPDPNRLSIQELIDTDRQVRSWTDRPADK